MDPPVASRVSPLNTSATLAHLSGCIVGDQRHAIDEAASHRAGVKEGHIPPYYVVKS
jgi:hypothetical protein